MTASAMTVTSHGSSGGGGPPSPTDSLGSQSELLGSASSGGSSAPTGNSALRRLHFKAARRTTAPSAAIHRNSSGSPVPKVIVMGSSTASDKTSVNTSTDSAATAVTSVTSVTVTDDSLDAETLETLQARDLADHRDSTDIQDSKDTLVNSSVDLLLPKDDEKEKKTEKKAAHSAQEPSSRAPDSAPSTAPPGYHRRHDPSIPAPPPASPAFAKPQSVTDLDSPRPRPSRFVFDVPLPQPPAKAPSPDKAKMLKDKTTSPVDLAVPLLASKDRRGSEARPRRRDSEENGTAARLKKLEIEGSVVYHGLVNSQPSHRRASQSSQRRQSAQINVTPNPLDSPSPSIPTGRTTIVVQQPSVSLDYPGGYSTVLVREEATSPTAPTPTEGPTRSHRRRGSKRRDRRQQLQQMLDVNAQLTADQLADFEKRYGSPHHCRSQSVRSSGERQLLGLPQQRARVASMPNTGVEEEYYRLRHFSITGKGVINRGDSLRSRRSRSNTSVASSASSTEHLSASAARTSAPGSLASSRDSSTGGSSYRVVVLGAPGVGKSSLVGQFMTSEYLHAYDTSIGSIDDESGERSVCVLLGGEESELTFLDGPQDFVPTSTNSDNVQAFCVVYSTAERASLQEAERHLQALWSSGSTRKRAVILVGNKADLARSRLVSTDEGKSMAISYDCKFIETSVGINHNVDELLVGILAQIRLKQQQQQQADKKASRESRRRRGRNGSSAPPLSAPASSGGGAPAPGVGGAAAPGGSAPGTPRRRPGRGLSASLKVRGLLGRVWPRDSKSKSCENLHVL